MDNPIEVPASTVFVAGTIAAARFVVLRREAAARERELLAQAAANEERLRIARELHDAVGHDVSLMVVQAEALAAVTGDERADAIAALGRRTMGEMHRTLKVLRDEAALAPQHGLRDLGEVIEGARAGRRADHLRGRGHAARARGPARRVRVPDRPGGGDERDPPRGWRRRGGHGPLPRGCARAARDRRGTRGAAGPRRADRCAGRRRLGAARRGRRAGHGLVGMRERVAAFGGTLEAGPRAGGGFEVHAELPYG